MDDKERLDAVVRNVEKLIKAYVVLHARVSVLENKKPPVDSAVDDIMGILGIRK